MHMRIRTPERSAASNDLTDQVALVAGASRGLGLLIGRELLGRGCRVAICARDEAELERAGTDLNARATRPNQVLTLRCDVTDVSQIESTVQEVTATWGPVDVLVHVAGVIQVGPASSLTIEDFARAMDTMFWAPVHLSRAVLPSMRDRGCGRIATITSIGGRLSVPHLLPYSCAKFAAVAYSMGMRAELAGSGVRVTTVVPGLMRTGSHLRADFGGRQEREYAWFALGASLPLVSMGAERAARRIVDAIARGRREVVLTPLAKVAARVNGLAPATTTALLEVMARLLPADPVAEGKGASASRLAEGRDAEARLDSTLLRWLTTLGRRAAERFNQIEPRSG
jgi:short-subunit dehydrogenase